MPVKAYDAEGNEIGELPTPEEYRDIQDKASKAAELEQKLNESNPKAMREAIERRDQRIERLKAALGPNAKFDDDGNPIVDTQVTPDVVKQTAQEVVRQTLDQEKKVELEEYQNTLLDQYARENDDVKKAIQAEFEELRGDRTLSKQQIDKFMTLARNTVLGVQTKGRSPSTVAGSQQVVGGGVDRTNKSRISRGIELAQKAGIRLNNPEGLIK